MISWTALVETVRQVFDRGGVTRPVGLTILRKAFGTRNALGEQPESWAILHRAISGLVLPEEGPLRALAEGSRMVQDWMLYMDPIYDATGQPVVQPNDLLVDGPVAVFPGGSFSATGTVYRVHNVQEYARQSWQIRLKSGQSGREA